MSERLSELWTQYGGPDVDVDVGDVETEAETGLLETLSALAPLDEIKTSFPPLQRLSDDISSNIATNEDSNTNIWRRGASLIARLILRLSPFDVHLSASQALLFSEDANCHFPAFCLLLCSWSLKKCPSELKRWKRWQSMLCETVRLSQTYRHSDWELSLWLDFLLPSFEALKLTLPSEALHIGIAAGLVGTTLELIADHPNQSSSCRLAIEGIMKNTEILCHPWRVSSFPQNVEQADRFELLKTNLAWWTECADGHDSVSAMDTTWNTRGMALLAWDCWTNQATSLTSPTESFNTFFPHVSNLLLQDDLAQHGLELLQDLCSVMPPRTIVEWQDVPTNPMGTIQLLSNKLVRASQLQDNASASSMAKLMQSLVQKYVPVSQVEMVQQLLDNCPYPGLEPKLLDLLRPLVREPCPELWDYLHQAYLKKMLEHVDETGNLENVEELVDRVESYVSAASMVQLHMLLRGVMPAGVDATTFGTMLWAVNEKANDWSNGDEQPGEFHRLFLLQSTLSQVVELGDITIE